MNIKKLFSLGIIMGAIGLCMLLVVIISGKAYPHMMFKIGAPIGLILIFISLIIWFISWLCYLKGIIKEKKYSWSIFIVLLGIGVIMKAFL